MIATVIVFFFKHKTAYYMRISDWSSDVCSSDLSREAMGDGMPFDAAAAWGERVLKRLIGAPWSPRTLVNINFPALPADEVKGVKVVDQGLRDYGRLRIIKGADPRGYDYYWRSEEHTSELQSLMRISYDVFCLKKKKKKH